MALVRLHDRPVFFLCTCRLERLHTQSQHLSKSGVWQLKTASIVVLSSVVRWQTLSYSVGAYSQCSGYQCRGRRTLYRVASQGYPPDISICVPFARGEG